MSEDTKRRRVDASHLRLVSVNNDALIRIADDLDSTATMRPVYYDPADSVTLHFKGLVIAKERPRMGLHTTYTPQKTVDYEKEVAKLGRAAMFAAGLRPYNRPVGVHLTVYEDIPQSWGRYKTRLALAGLILPEKRDLDNQIKAIMDGLNGVCFADDSLVNQIFAVRKFVQLGGAGFSLNLFPTGISYTDAINVENILKNRGKHGIGR